MRLLTLKVGVNTILISKTCGIRLREIEPESTLQSLKLNTLDSVEIIIAVEKEFDIKLPIQEWNDCNTINDFCKLIDKTLDAQK